MTILILLCLVISSSEKHPSISKSRLKSLVQPFISKKLAAMKLKRLSANQQNIKKSCQQEDIPTKIIKLNIDLIAKFIAENFNSCIDEGEFPSELKHADIVSIHQKKDKSDKSNYRPVSILSNYSKVYEKLIYNQL